MRIRQFVLLKQQQAAPRRGCCLFLLSLCSSIIRKFQFTLIGLGVLNQEFAGIGNNFLFRGRGSVEFCITLQPNS